MAARSSMTRSDARPAPTASSLPSLEGCIPRAPEFVRRNQKAWAVFERLIKKGAEEPLPSMFDSFSCNSKLFCVLGKAYNAKFDVSDDALIIIDGEKEEAQLSMRSTTEGFSPYLRLRIEETNWVIDPAWLVRLRSMIGDRCTPDEIQELVTQVPFILIAREDTYPEIINGIWLRLKASGKAGDTDPMRAPLPEYHQKREMHRLLESEWASEFRYCTFPSDLAKALAEIESFRKEEGSKREADKETSPATSSSSSGLHAKTPARSGCSREDFERMSVSSDFSGMHQHKDGYTYYMKKDAVQEFYAGNLYKLILGDSAPNVILVVRNEDTFYAGSEVDDTFMSMYDYHTPPKGRILRSEDEELANIVVASWLLGEKDLKGYDANQSNVGVVTSKTGKTRYFKIDAQQALNFENSFGFDFTLDAAWLEKLSAYSRIHNLDISAESLRRAARRIANLSSSDFDRVCTFCESQLAPFSKTVDRYVSVRKPSLFLGDPAKTTIKDAVLARVHLFRTLVDGAASSSSSGGTPAVHAGIETSKPVPLST